MKWKFSYTPAILGGEKKDDEERKTRRKGYIYILVSERGIGRRCTDSFIGLLLSITTVPRCEDYPNQSKLE